ncbi:MAG TPA: hypothetical protein ENI85_11990 [Deltaproteobacteria bacterium]|nr:hypothetical protein [Deltaproteobacteria bacterium]
MGVGSGSEGAGGGNPPRLLDQLRRQLRVRHRSLSTERSYVGWVKRFIFFHGVRMACGIRRRWGGSRSRRSSIIWRRIGGWRRARRIRP